MRSTAIVVALAACTAAASGQEIWSGYDLEFVKPDGSDWTLPENQDLLTDNVILTRQERRGVYNIAVEPFYAGIASPADTAWAIGTTADLDALAFDCWECIAGSNPQSLVGQNAVVHLITDDIYVDIRFTSWSCCGAGGFGYVRGLPDVACRADLDGDGELTLFDFLAFQNLFAAGNLAADFDGDGSLTIFDFLAFQNEFASGCP
ncbi:MAG: GC-type dockerin domain-anchored protein [Planctomycetota bacterium]